MDGIRAGAMQLIMSSAALWVLVLGVATDQAEKNFLTFPDFKKSNSFKLILKYIINHFKLYKALNLIYIQIKTTVFFC